MTSPTWHRPVSRWGPAVAWMAAIAFFSSRSRPLGPLSEGPHASFIGRLAHIAEYAVLAALCYRALSPDQSSRRRLAFSWAATVTFAITDELHQSFVPGRECSVHDLFCDTLGATLSLLLVTLAEHKAPEATARLLQWSPYAYDDRQPEP